MSPDEFIEEAEAQLRNAGLYDRVRVDLSAPPFQGVISINYLEVTDPANRGKRLATAALQLLLHLSDNSGFALDVIPRSFDGPLDDDALAAWYRRHGFRPITTPPDTGREMRREPSGSAATDCR